MFEAFQPFAPFSLKALSGGRSLAALIRALFANNEKGVWYDPSDLSTMFQDSSGTTAVAVGDPVGMILDKSKGLVLGSELVPASALTSTAGWGAVTNGTLASVNDELVLTATAAGLCYVDYLISGPANTSYVLTATARRGQAAGLAYISLAYGSVPYVAFAASQSNNSVRLQRDVSGSPQTIRIRFDADAGGQSAIFSAISVKELPGNHATQATSTARPILARHPITGGRNLLTYSEQFDNAVWSDISAGVTSKTYNYAVAPDGTQTACRVVGNNANTWFANTSGGSGRALSQLTESLYIKLNSGAQTGEVALKLSVAGGTTFSQAITATSEWTRVSITGILLAGDTGIVRSAINIGNGNDLLIWHPQLEVGSTPTAYQKVVSTHDVTEVGVADAYYLKFDGIDDSLATAAINFSATDKMSVFAGVRKLSDAAGGTVACLSTNPGGTANVFSLDAPGSVAANYRGYLRGTTDTFKLVTTYTAPHTAVLSAGYDFAAIAGAKVSMRINAATGSEALTDNTAIAAGFSSNSPISVGGQASTYRFNGHIYSLIVRGALSDATQITNAEKFVNSKTGAY